MKKESKKHVVDAYGRKIPWQSRHTDTVMGGKPNQPLIIDSPVGYEKGQQLDKKLTKIFDRIDRGIKKLGGKDERYKQKMYNRYINFISTRYESDLDYHFNKELDDE